MKKAGVFFVYVLIASAAFGFWGYVAIRFERAASALEAAANDYRDAFINYEAERLRVMKRKEAKK